MGMIHIETSKRLIGTMLLGYTMVQSILLTIFLWVGWEGQMGIWGRVAVCANQCGNIIIIFFAGAGPGTIIVRGNMRLFRQLTVASNITNLIYLSWIIMAIYSPVVGFHSMPPVRDGPPP